LFLLAALWYCGLSFCYAGTNEGAHIIESPNIVDVNVAAPQGNAGAVAAAQGDPVAGDVAEGAAVASDVAEGVAVAGDAAEGDAVAGDSVEGVDEDADQGDVNARPTWFLAPDDTKQRCQLVGTPSVECSSKSKFSPRGNSGFNI
jgi:hypothetical protein